MPWRVLNAADFGVPQNRERLILLGAKNGLRLPDYPEASTDKPTCQDALDDLPDADMFHLLTETDEIRLPGSAWKWPAKYAREMRCLSNDAWHFGYVREWDRQVLTSSMRTTHTDISRRRFAATKESETEPISRFFKLSATGLSNTLRAGTDAARGAFTSPRPIHYRYPRCITVREMARLHGFPDWFRFQQTKWHGARQIGNAVPPPLARTIGNAVIAAMRKEPKKPEKPILLGDPALLRMDVGEASEHWGVKPPIGKRDRKSGARKRSQLETEAARLLAQGGVGAQNGFEF